MIDLIYHNVTQGEPEWHAVKAGKFSASKAAVIMGGLDTAGLDSYIQDLAWERLYGPIEGGYKSAAMDRGNIMEPESRDWYQLVEGIEVSEVGFVQRPDFMNCGWSPDGLIQTLTGLGAIEAKNPLHKAWMECKRTGKIPSQYRWQCRFGMWIGGLEFLDFVSYHPAAGGLIVPAEVTESEKQQMAERVTLLESKVQVWLDILTDKKGK